MQYTGMQVAGRVINWYHEHACPITNLRLQKLLYFLQGEYYHASKNRLINDDFYAWKLGPVIPNVYQTFSIFSSTSIPKLDKCDTLTQDVERIINEAMEKYAHKSTWQLVEQSHDEDPWKYNFMIFGDRSIIPFDSIARYYGGKA